MNKPSYRLKVLLLLVLGVLSGGCATSSSTPTPRYFLIEAPRLEATAATARSLRVSIGPVEVAEYLDQPLLATRHTEHELKLLDYERWATPLAQQIPLVLRESIEQLVPGARTSGFPSTLGAGFDYRVAIEIQRFDGRLGGEVELVANWRVYAPDGTAIGAADGQMRVRAPTGGADIAAVVATQAELLGRLARGITDKLLDLK